MLHLVNTLSSTIGIEKIPYWNVNFTRKEWEIIRRKVEEAKVSAQTLTDRTECGSYKKHLKSNSNKSVAFNAPVNDFSRLFELLFGVINSTENDAVLATALQADPLISPYANSIDITPKSTGRKRKKMESDSSSSSQLSGSALLVELRCFVDDAPSSACKLRHVLILLKIILCLIEKHPVLVGDALRNDIESLAVDPSTTAVGQVQPPNMDLSQFPLPVHFARTLMNLIPASAADFDGILVREMERKRLDALLCGNPHVTIVCSDNSEADHCSVPLSHMSNSACPCGPFALGLFGNALGVVTGVRIVHNGLENDIVDSSIKPILEIGWVRGCFAANFPTPNAKRVRQRITRSSAVNSPSPRPCSVGDQSSVASSTKATVTKRFHYYETVICGSNSAEPPHICVGWRGSPVVPVPFNSPRHACASDTYILYDGYCNMLFCVPSHCVLSLENNVASIQSIWTIAGAICSRNLGPKYSNQYFDFSCRANSSCPAEAFGGFADIAALQRAYLEALKGEYIGLSHCEYGKDVDPMEEEISTMSCDENDSDDSDDYSNYGMDVLFSEALGGRRACKAVDSMPTFPWDGSESSTDVSIAINTIAQKLTTRFDAIRKVESCSYKRRLLTREILLSVQLATWEAPHVEVPSSSNSRKRAYSSVGDDDQTIPVHNASHSSASGPVGGLHITETGCSCVACTHAYACFPGDDLSSGCVAISWKRNCVISSMINVVENSFPVTDSNGVTKTTNVSAVFSINGVEVLTVSNANVVHMVWQPTLLSYDKNCSAIINIGSSPFKHDASLVHSWNKNPLKLCRIECLPVSALTQPSILRLNCGRTNGSSVDSSECYLVAKNHPLLHLCWPTEMDTSPSNVASFTFEVKFRLDGATSDNLDGFKTVAYYMHNDIKCSGLFSVWLFTYPLGGVGVKIVSVARSGCNQSQTHRNFSDFSVTAPGTILHGQWYHLAASVTIAVSESKCNLNVSWFLNGKFLPSLVEPAADEEASLNSRAFCSVRELLCSPSCGPLGLPPYENVGCAALVSSDEQMAVDVEECLPNSELRVDPVNQATLYIGAKCDSMNLIPFNSLESSTTLIDEEHMDDMIVAHAFTGDIAEVRVWSGNRTLNDLESCLGRGYCQNLRGSGASKLLACWNMDLCCGSLVFNSAMSQDPLRSGNVALIRNVYRASHCDFTWTTDVSNAGSSVQPISYDRKKDLRLCESFLKLGANNKGVIYSNIMQALNPVSLLIPQQSCFGLIPGVILPLLKACSNYMSVREDESMSKSEMIDSDFKSYLRSEDPNIGFIMDPSVISFLLISSILRQLMRLSNKDGQGFASAQLFQSHPGHGSQSECAGELTSIRAVLNSAAAAVMWILRVNIIGMYEKKISPWSLGLLYSRSTEGDSKCLPIKLFQCMMFFASQENDETEESCRTLVACFNILFPKANEKLEMLQFMAYKLLMSYSKSPVDLADLLKCGQPSESSFFELFFRYESKVNQLKHVSEFPFVVTEPLDGVFILPSSKLLALFCGVLKYCFTGQNGQPLEDFLRCLGARITSQSGDVPATVVSPVALFPSGESGVICTKLVNSTSLMKEIPSIFQKIIVPRAGDLVARGPDWCYGAQDEACTGTSGADSVTSMLTAVGNITGMVIDVVPWSQDGSILGIVVLWPCGNSNIYRFGCTCLLNTNIIDASSAPSCRRCSDSGGVAVHDVVVIKRPLGSVLGDVFEWTSKCAADKDGPSNTDILALVEMELFSPEKVVSDAATDIVFGHIGLVAPLNWLRDKNLLFVGSGLNISPSRMYSLFAELLPLMSKVDKKTSSDLSMGKRFLACEQPSSLSILGFSVLLMHLVQVVDSNFSGLVEIRRALCTVNGLICGSIRSTVPSGPTQSRGKFSSYVTDSICCPVAVKHMLVEAPFVGKHNKSLYQWSLKHDSNSLRWKSCETGDSASLDSVSAVRRSSNVVELKSMKFPSTAPSSKLIVDRSCKTIQASGMKAWNTVVCSVHTTMRPHSGTYKWFICIDNLSPSGQCMIGLVSRQFKGGPIHSGRLGFASHTWGVSSKEQCVYVDGKATSCNIPKLSIGASLQISVDTDRGEFLINDVVIPVDISGETLHPAFSLYAAGDSLCILSKLPFGVSAVFPNSCDTPRESDAADMCSLAPRINTTFCDEKCLHVGCASSVFTEYICNILSLSLVSLQSCHGASALEKSLQNCVVLSLLPQALSVYCKYQFMPLLNRQIISPKKDQNEVALLENLQKMLKLISSKLSTVEKLSDIPFVIENAGSSFENTTNIIWFYSQLHCLVSFLINRLICSQLYGSMYQLDNLSIDLAHVVYGHQSKTDLKLSLSDNGANAAVIALLKSPLLLKGLKISPALADMDSTSESGNLFQTPKKSMFSGVTVTTSCVKPAGTGFYDTPVTCSSSGAANNHVALVAELVEISQSEISSQTNRVGVLYNWLMKHDKLHKSYGKLGGAPIQRAVRAVFCALIYHAGLFPLLVYMLEGIQERINQLAFSGSSSVRFDTMNKDSPCGTLIVDWDCDSPPQLLLTAWLISARFRDSINRSISYECLGIKWSSRAAFLMKFVQVHDDRLAVEVLASSEIVSSSVESSRSSYDIANSGPFDRASSHCMQVLRCVESDLRELGCTIRSFIVDSRGLAPLCKLHACAHANWFQARARIRAYNSLHTTLVSTESVERHEDGYACASSTLLVLGLPTALRNLTVASENILWSSCPLLCNKSRNASSPLFWPFCSAATPHCELLSYRAAYSELLTYIVTELGSCSLSGDNNSLILALINCLGLYIQEEDHEVLYRSNAFRVLQELYDSCNLTLRSMCGNSDSDANADDSVGKYLSVHSGGVYSDDEIGANCIVLLTATMKLTYVLALQVAMYDDGFPSEYCDALHTAPVLKRALSGPSTLGASVFEMIHVQLSTACCDMEGKVGATNTEVNQSFIPIINIYKDTHELILEATELLLFVSDVPSCRAQLLEWRWCALLLRLAVLSPMNCRVRSLNLLCKILPAMPTTSSEVEDGGIKVLEGVLRARSYKCLSLYDDLIDMLLSMCKYFTVYNDICFSNKALRDRYMDVWVNVTDDAIKNRGDNSTAVMNFSGDFLYDYAGMHNVIASEAVVVVRTLLDTAHWNDCVEMRLAEHLNAEKASLVHSLCKMGGNDEIGENSVDAVVLFTASAAILGGHIDCFYESAFVRILDPLYRYPDGDKSTIVGDSVVQIMRDVQHSSDNLYVSSIHLNNGNKSHNIAGNSDNQVHCVPKCKVKPISKFPVSSFSKGMVSHQLLSTLFSTINKFGIDFWKDCGSDSLEFSEEEESKVESESIEEKFSEDDVRVRHPVQKFCCYRGVMNMLLKCLCELTSTNPFVLADVNSFLSYPPANGVSGIEVGPILSLLLQLSSIPVDHGTAASLDVWLFEDYSLLCNLQLFTLSLGTGFRPGDSIVDGGTLIPAAPNNDGDCGPPSQKRLKPSLTPRNVGMGDAEGLDPSSIETLCEMGFPRFWCTAALRICAGDPDGALNYILSNGDLLRRMEELEAVQELRNEIDRARCAGNEQLEAAVNAELTDITLPSEVPLQDEVSIKWAVSDVYNSPYWKKFEDGIKGISDKIKDRMEVLGGCDLYRKEHRYFGRGQGADTYSPWGIDAFGDFRSIHEPVKVGADDEKSRKLILGDVLTSVVTKKLASKSRSCLEEISNSISVSRGILYCRKCVLSMMLRHFKSEGMEDHINRDHGITSGGLLNIISSCGGLDGKYSSDKKCEDLYHFFRMILFRGCPFTKCSIYGELMLTVFGQVGLLRKTLIEGSTGMEYYLAQVVQRLLVGSVGLAADAGIGASSLSNLKTAEIFRRRLWGKLLLSIQDNIALVFRSESLDVIWEDMDSGGMEDKEVLRTPNIPYAQWASMLLLNTCFLELFHNAGKIEEERTKYCEVVLLIIKMWRNALLSASMSFKHVAFGSLSELLRRSLEWMNKILVRNGDCEGTDTALIQSILNKIFIASCGTVDDEDCTIPFNRLVAIGAKELQFELEDFPMFSRYFQGLFELLATVQQVRDMITNAAPRFLSSSVPSSVTSDSIGNVPTLLDYKMHMEEIDETDQEDAEFLSVLATESTDCTISLNPPRELQGSWTVEFWLYRRDVEDSKSNQCEIPSGTTSNDGMDLFPRTSSISIAPVAGEDIHASPLSRRSPPNELSSPVYSAESNSISGGRTPTFSVYVDDDFSRTGIEDTSLKASGEESHCGLDPIEKSASSDRNGNSSSGGVFSTNGTDMLGVISGASSMGGSDEATLSEFESLLRMRLSGELSDNAAASLNLLRQLSESSGFSREHSGGGLVRENSGLLSSRKSGLTRQSSNSSMDSKVLTKCTDLPSIYLLSSPLGHIKLQRGGHVISDFVNGEKDPHQKSIPVNDQAYCISIGSTLSGYSNAVTGNTDRVFDYVVPKNEWVHIALVCHAATGSGKTSSNVILYANGIERDVICMKFLLPLHTVGLYSGGAGKIDVETVSETGFTGEIGMMRVWSAAKHVTEIRRNMYFDMTGAKSLLSNIVLQHPVVAESMPHSVQLVDTMGFFSLCSASKHWSWKRIVLSSFRINCEDLISRGFINEVIKGCPPKLTSNPLPLHLIGCDIEDSVGLYGQTLSSASSPIYELVGAVRLHSGRDYCGGKISGTLEVIVVVFSIVSSNGCDHRIEGYLEWTQRGGCRSFVAGQWNRDSDEIKFAINKRFSDKFNNGTILGSSDELHWFDNIEFCGKVEGGCRLRGKVVVEKLGPLIPYLDAGKVRVCELSMPSPVAITHAKSAMRQEALVPLLTVVNENASCSADALYNISIENTPACRVFDGESLPCLDDLDASAINIESGDIEIQTQPLYGLCRSEGCLWVQWRVVMSVSGKLLFGVRTAADNIFGRHRESSEHGCSWYYSQSGACYCSQESIPLMDVDRDQFTNAFKENDLIDVQIDGISGKISFFLNNRIVCQCSVLTHPLFQLPLETCESTSIDIESPMRATIPSTGNLSTSSLCSAASSPTAPTPNMFGTATPVPLASARKLVDVAHGFRPFVCLRSGGDSVAFEGHKDGFFHLEYPARVASSTVDVFLNNENWISLDCWIENGNFNGVGCLSARVKMPSVEEDECLWTTENRGLNVSSSEENCSVVCEYWGMWQDGFPNGIHFKVLHQSSPDTSNEFIVPYVLKQGVCEGVMKAGMHLNLCDVQDCWEMLKSYKDKWDFGKDGKVERVMNIPVGTAVAEGDEKMKNDISNVDVSIARWDALDQRRPDNDKLQLKCMKPNVPFYQSMSASSLVTGTVPLFEVVDAIRMSSNDGFSWCRTPDGYVILSVDNFMIESEKYNPHRKYKVIRPGGARVREGAEMSSAEVGVLPCECICTVSESRRFAPESEYEGVSIRLLISHPTTYVGWISDKSHIVTQVLAEDIGKSLQSNESSLSGVDVKEKQQLIRAELERRSLVRARKSQLQARAGRRLDVVYGKAMYCSIGSNALGSDSLLPSTKRMTRERSIFRTGDIDISSDRMFLLSGKSAGANSASLKISGDFASVSHSPDEDSRCMAIGSKGFCKGVHYWEVLVESAGWGSVYIGVCPAESSGWGGYGVMNYRAVLSQGIESLYGSYFSAGDTVGVLLNMDSMMLSFFKVGEDFNLSKFVVVNMGVAVKNLRSRNSKLNEHGALYPCFGVKSGGDKLSIKSSRWLSEKGKAYCDRLNYMLESYMLLSSWNRFSYWSPEVPVSSICHGWDLGMLYKAYKNWKTSSLRMFCSRPGMRVLIDTSSSSIANFGRTVSSLNIRGVTLKYGTPIKTQFGVGKLVGVRGMSFDCNGYSGYMSSYVGNTSGPQLWYLYESTELSGAWYWTAAQLESELEKGSLTIMDDEAAIQEGNLFRDTSQTSAGLNSLMASAMEVVESTPCVNSRSASGARSEVMSFEEFSLLFSGKYVDEQTGSISKWTKEEDCALVEMINDYSARFQCDPLSLSPTELATHCGATCVPTEGSSLLVVKSVQELEVRYMCICVINRAFEALLPVTDFARKRSLLLVVDTSKYSSGNTGANCNSGMSRCSGIASMVASMKGLIFTRIKNTLWNVALRNSTTPTSCPGDEYERPDDLREYAINRLESRQLFDRLVAAGVRQRSGGSNEFPDRISDDGPHSISHTNPANTDVLSPELLKMTVFGQLLEKLSPVDDRSLRRSYVFMLDAGQQRCFFVKMVGEGADDHGGPYRAVFQTALGEEIDQILRLLVPCGNAVNETGGNRDRMVFNASHMSDAGAGKKSVLRLYYHLGRLIGICCRHHIHVPICLPNLVWKPLVREALRVEELADVDVVKANSIKNVTQLFDPATRTSGSTTISDGSSSCQENDDRNELLAQLLNGYDDHWIFSTNCMRAFAVPVGTACRRSGDVLRIANSLLNDELELDLGSSCKANEGRSKSSICEILLGLHLTYHAKGLQEVYRGLAAIVPAELLSMYTATELEELICGKTDLNVDVLQRATVYEGAVKPTDPHVLIFWDVLRNMSTGEKSKFINFCSGRSRLPTSASDFDMNFKLIGPPPLSENNPDEYLPVAQTCFFSLSLPKYTCYEVCQQKLIYAISNTQLIDADFNVRNANGWENIQ